MTRKRNSENLGLPQRWRTSHGAYYYQVPPGLESLWDDKKLFRLGKTLPEAYAEWARRLESTTPVRTVGELLDEYANRVIPTNAITTQHQKAFAMVEVRKVFGKAPLAGVKPRHIYKYYDKRPYKTAAHHELELLSHAFSKAIEWGYMDTHPFMGLVKLPGRKARTRYVEDWEVVEALSLKSRRKVGSVLAVQAYIRIKLLIGLRRGDLLRLKLSSLREDGIHVTPGKTEDSTGKRLIFTWSAELRAAVEIAKAARPVHISPWLFCNRCGECYFDETTGRAGGFDTMWRNFMGRLLHDTKVTEHFTEHDLRAKCASDAESLERACTLLAHADSRITDKVYRRRPERIAPAR